MSEKTLAFLTKALVFCIKLIFKLTLTVGLFVLLFRPETFGLDPLLFGGVTPALMLQELREAGARNIALWLSFAIVVKLAGMFAGLVRWRLLLLGQGLRIPFFYMIKSWFIGRMIGTFLPGTLGLDGYRLLDSSRYTGEVLKCTTVIAVEKLIGFISLTFLVFLTFPLGFRLLDIKVPVLMGILTCLAGFVSISLILLFNPRVIQIIVAVLPTPKKIRHHVDRFGQAISAYSGRRGVLIMALICGILVHLGTALMFFGTMMAIRAENTGLLDILFAAPIMIYGTVIGPSIGGEGIREIVFVTLLSSKSGATAAATFAHLGWWVDQFVPFTLGAFFFFLTSRPTKEEVLERMADLREKQRDVPFALQFTPEAIASYRIKLFDCLLAGLSAGLIGGAMVGLGEAAWMSRFLVNPSELMMYWWAPLIYGIVFTGVGVGVACCFSFLFLLLDRFPPVRWTFSLSLFLTVLPAGLVIGIFRVMRDIANDHLPNTGQLTQVGLIAFLVAATAAVVGIVVMRVIKAKRPFALVGAFAVYLGLVLLGASVSGTSNAAAQNEIPSVSSAPGSPNVILIGIDTLRADYLKLYADDAVAETPQLEAFAKNSVLFKNGFAQCSWTKPSFATIFSGLFPTTHTATGYKSALPDSVVTIAERLRDAGYYTKGFANNPNISPDFNFAQGFADYVDLKPSLYLGAKSSAEKLVMYQILRRVIEKLPFRKSVVTNYYQPADNVNQFVFDWMDSGARPADRPFYLFVHYFDPHDPYFNHENSGESYSRVKMRNPDPDRWLGRLKDAYVSEIEFLDYHLGQLFEGLKSRGLYDKSIIILTADHGEEFFDHGGWWHGESLYDEQLHIPYIIKLPDGQLAGQTNTGITRHVDIAPSILALTGLPPSADLPGVALFQGSDMSPNGFTNFVFSELDFEGYTMQSLRNLDAKLIREQVTPNGKPENKFFDVRVDADELTNLYGTGDDRQAVFENAIQDAQTWTQKDAVEMQQIQDLSPSREEQLNSLGYTGG